MKSIDKIRDRLKRAIQEYTYKEVNSTFRPFEAGQLNTEIKVLEWVLEEKP